MTSNEGPQKTVRRLGAILTSATLLFCALPLAASAKPVDENSSVIVCNERENSHRGGYTVTQGPVDPNPRDTNSQATVMRVGEGRGVANAAEHSPALRICSNYGGGDF